MLIPVVLGAAALGADARGLPHRVQHELHCRDRNGRRSGHPIRGIVGGARARRGTATHCQASEDRGAVARPGTDGEKRAAEQASNRIRARLSALEEIEPAVEFRFSFADAWSRSLFIAVLRRHGLKPYRYHGQRRSTVMVRAVKSYVDATLWPEFLQLQAVLHQHFEAVTKRVIAQAIGAEDDDVELRSGQALDG